jgi:16S rRNA (guanine1207-N2)-methyltransferase
VSRRSRDEAAAALVLAALERDPPTGPAALVLEDPLPLVADAVQGTGVPVASWTRWAADPDWPLSDGSLEWVAMRLPRARAELDLLTHMAAGALAEGGRLWVYGANDEGARSVARRLEPLFHTPETLATGGHARLVAATRAPRTVEARAGWDAWFEATWIDAPWGRVEWWSFAGTFAHGRLDEGTALLLDNLPPVEAGDRVLDYGTGTGFLAAGVLAEESGAVVVGLEPDGLAATAASRNVPAMALRVGAGWGALSTADEQPWDVVVSNPPYHRGKAETLAEVDAFLGGLARHLAPRGVARCVVQRRFPLEQRADAARLARPRPVADAGPYRVWELRRG